jgi:RNA polymerase sigma factor (sigma-70 family)
MGKAKNAQRTATFERERRHLLAIAFRILGSDSDAEDVVQETWIKFDSADTSEVRNVPAWLTTVATRLCLDALRRRREVPSESTVLFTYSDDEPEEAALLAEELTAAFVLVLDELTPPQRVALVLHDAFGVPFDELAHILGTTTASAKKLASRARSRVRRQPVAPAEDAAKARVVVEAFLHAVQKGDTQRLIALLDPNVVRIADPQVLPPGAPQRIRGAQTVAAETSTYQANALRARIAVIDGRPGIAVLAASKVQSVLVVRIAGDRIIQYDVIADPQRLARLDVRIAEDAE